MIRGSRRSGPNSLTDAIAAGCALLRSESSRSEEESETKKLLSVAFHLRKGLWRTGAPARKRGRV